MKVLYYVRDGMPKESVARQAHLKAAAPLNIAPLQDPHFISAACDSGYGSSLSLYGAADPRFAALTKYLNVRARAILSTLEPAAPNGYRLTSFMLSMDGSEVGRDGFVLGGICARLAVKAWLRKFYPNWDLAHFWHRSVYACKAASTAFTMDKHGSLNRT